MGGDVVGVGQDELVVAVVVLHGHLHGGGLHVALHADAGEVQGLGLQQLLVLVEEGDELPDAALVAVALRPVGLHPLVGEGDPEARVQKRQLPQAQPQGVVAELQGVEDVGIGPEMDGGAGLGDLALLHVDAVQRDAPRIVLDVELALPADLHPKLLRQGVHAGKTHAMKAAGDLVAPAAELAACMEDGQGHLQSVLAGLLMVAHGDAAAVVPDGDAVALVEEHLDMGAEPGQSFVHAVVHDLGDQLVQSPLVRGTDVHAGAAAHGLQPLQHLDLGSVVASGHFVANVFHAFVPFLRSVKLI